MVLSVKDLLQELLRIPSVNPAFAAGDSSICGESRVTDFLQNFFDNLHLPWFRQQVHPGRDNLLVVLRSSGEAAARRVRLWEVHQDTVGVAGMKIDPFAASEAEGRIWGRGACDVKGGMAAMLAAVARIQAEQTTLPHDLVIAFTVNEECGFSGVKALSKLWAEAHVSADGQGPLSLADVRQLRPDEAIVAEPTLFDVVVAHKGCVRWRCHTRGKAAHTSRPEKGTNAISAMMRVVQAIDAYQREVLDAREAHPLCGAPTICVSTIAGGSGVNTVPDHAVIDIDYRLLPGDEPMAAWQSLIDYLAAACPDDRLEHEPPSNQCVGLLDDNNRGWAEHVSSVAQTAGERPTTHAGNLIGVPYGTDAWVLSSIDIPTVVFGPGSIDQAHTDDEWIEIDQLQRAADIFYELATKP